MPSPRILVVDDEPAILTNLKTYFTKLGYDVDCAQEVREAEALLSGGRHALVILDLTLGGGNGEEGLALIPLAHQHSRVILLTAYGSASVAEEAKRLGADVVLQKPKPLPELAQIAMYLIAVHGEMSG
jgi:DNA-binding response OmpR family regulator